jgi:hypothetical protein
VPRFYCTHFVGRDGPNDADYSYLADAEVDLSFTATAGVALFGKMLSFRFRPTESIWCGHLDDSNPVPGRGWPRETGNARICIHDLILLPKKFPPLGYPFGVGSSLEIFSEQANLGSCMITRLHDYTTQSVQLAPPAR